jgi:hypothetical protein
VNAIADISDWAYNETSGKYEPTDRALSEISDINYSIYLDLNAVIATPKAITTTLLCSPTLTASVSVLKRKLVSCY